MEDADKGGDPFGEGYPVQALVPIDRAAYSRTIRKQTISSRKESDDLILILIIFDGTWVPLIGFRWFLDVVLGLITVRSLFSVFISCY